MRLLHGTSSAHVEEILRSGFLRNPFLTPREPMAWYFAEEAAGLYDKGPAHPVVLEVVIPDTDRLRADMVMFAEPIMESLDELGYPSSYAYHQALKAGDIPLPRNDKDWETSLDIMGSVQYAGDIPSGLVTVYDKAE